MELGSNLLGHLLDTTDGLDIEFLWRELDGSIARVNTRILDVLRDGVSYDLALICHGIHLDLLSTLDEARDDHWMLLADVSGHLEEAHELVLI